MLNLLNQLALWTDKNLCWWIGLSVPFTIIMTVITAITPGLPARGIYKSYYVHMLPRVQTVDFNMLFHMLPATLSNAMAGHHIEEIKSNPSKYKQISKNIQAILDSNYGVFYLLVTHENIKPSDIERGKGEDILYETHNQGLTDILDRGYIVHSDLILYPQPSCSTVSYPDPKSETPIPNNECQAEIEKAIAEGRSKVLGRVHYVKGKTPSFWKIAQNFQNNFLSDDSGYHFIRYYLLFMFIIFFLFYWVVYTFLKYTASQHRLKENELETLYFEKQLIESEYQTQVLREKNQRIEAENKLWKLVEFDRVFRNQIDTIFTSEVGNALQKLDAEYVSIFKRLETDVQNITHDMRKAPILSTLDAISLALKNVEKANSIDKKIDIIIETLKKIDKSIQVINEVINNLDEMISLDKKLYRLCDLLDDFQKKLPENVKDIPIEFICGNNTKDKSIEFICGKCEYLININRWHFRSILKNILYNSRRELVRLRMEKKRVGQTFQPCIRILCSVDKDSREAQIIVEDNGEGIPEKYLNKIYQSPERLNNSNGSINGNGSMIVFAYLSFHNGKAKAENIKDNNTDDAKVIGARVTISLPIVESTIQKPDQEHLLI